MSAIGVKWKPVHYKGESHWHTLKHALKQVTEYNKVFKENQVLSFNLCSKI